MREWTPLENWLWLARERVRQVWILLTTHKCEAKDCKRRLDGKYRWCSIECYVYCGNKLSDLPRNLEPEKEKYDTLD